MLLHNKSNKGNGRRAGAFARNAGGRSITTWLFVGGLLLLGGLAYAWTSVISKAVPMARLGSVSASSEIAVSPVISSKMLLNFPDTTTVMLYNDFGCEGKDGHKEPSKVIHVTEATEFENLCTAGKTSPFKSVKLIGGRFEADAFSVCGKLTNYGGTIMAGDGCVDLTSYPSVRTLDFKRTGLMDKQIDGNELAEQLVGQTGIEAGAAVGKYRIVFSAESAEYFGYQVLANYYGFKHSEQNGATWTRLLTSMTRDDLADMKFTTFQAKRHLYSRRYSPINKPDVITKWYQSVDAPQEEVIVVIDPDNWLLKSVEPWVAKVKRGQAVGERAYYYGSSRADKVWKMVCKKNCDAKLDLVGVPYVVHRDDLAEIAPLWREYSIIIKELMSSRNPNSKAFLKEFGTLGIEWAAEMFGYNFASAHAGVKHEAVSRMQVRDVDGERSKTRLKDVAMIHMGRAWFPKDYPPAQKWAHTEGHSFHAYGQQVWCKCNYTASTIVPWPVPEGADFQSTKTLEILHNSLEELGPIPDNPHFRKGTVNQRLFHHHPMD